MYILKKKKNSKLKRKILLEDTNHLHLKHWGKFTTAFKLKLTVNRMSEINPHTWHFTALLLYGDGKNCPLLNTPAHRAIHSVNSFHRFIDVCILFTVHLIPIQWDLLQKDRFPCLDSSEELRFANSHCKDTFKAHKILFFGGFFEQETKIMWNNITEHIAMKSDMWVTKTLRQNTKLPRDCFLNGSISDFSPTCGRAHWIANRNIQAHFGLHLQVPVESQILKKHISVWHSCITNTY